MSSTQTNGHFVHRYRSLRPFPDPSCCTPHHSNMSLKHRVPYSLSGYHTYSQSLPPYNHQPHHFVHAVADKPAMLHRKYPVVQQYKTSHVVKSSSPNATVHNRRKIRRPIKTVCIKKDDVRSSDSEDEVEIDVTMETRRNPSFYDDNRENISDVSEYNKKVDVMKVLFPELNLKELTNFFDNFNGDIQATVEHLLAKKRARALDDHRELDEYPPTDKLSITTTSTTRPNNTCHRIETLIKNDNSKNN